MFDARVHMFISDVGRSRLNWVTQQAETSVQYESRSRNGPRSTRKIIKISIVGNLTKDLISKDRQLMTVTKDLISKERQLMTVHNFTL